MRRLRTLAGALVVLAALAPGAHAHGGAGRAPGLPTAQLTHGPDPARTLARPLRAPALARAASAPAPWCGDQRATDDTRHEADRRSHRFHAVYAVPADAAPRLHAVAAGLQADARTASALLEGQHGRGIRFDRGTRCGPGHLDITTVRLPQTTSELERLAAGAGVLDAVARALDRAGLRTARLGTVPRGVAGRTNYVVWLDGPAPPESCGQATFTLDRRRTPSNANNAGGKVAAIFRDGEGFCGPATVLHEIAHTLGAVQPRAAGGAWSGHCDDAPADVMCDATAADLPPGAAALELDAGHDDYWDPPSGAPLRWWTMNLSRFVCPDAACRPARATRRR